MLRFIKSLFAQEEKKEERVSIKELADWLDSKSKNVFDDLKNGIDETIRLIYSEKEGLLQDIKKLEKAELQNPNIPNRAKTIMQGNRDAFIKKVSFFHDSIGLEYEDFDEIERKCRQVKNEIDELAKSTARSYAISNEFFSRELRAITQSIKKIEDLCKAITNLIAKSKMHGILSLKNDIVDLHYKIRLKESLVDELKTKHIELENKKNELIELENNIRGQKESDDYKDYENYLTERNNFEKKLNEIDGKLFHDFSFIDRALKKYAKIAFENENTINSYIENPIRALKDDGNLEIARILESLRKAIEQNKLEIDVKKNEKILAKLKELDKDYFTRIKDEHKKIKDGFENIKIKIEGNKAKKHLDEYGKEHSNLNDNIGMANNDVLNLKNEIEKIDIEKLKGDLKNNIKNTLNYEIIII